MSASPPAAERIGLWLSRDDDTARGSAALRPILEALADSFLPPAEELEPIGRKPEPISGVLDPAVLKALDSKQQGIRLFGPGGLHIEILQLRSGTVLTALFPPGAPTDQVRALFKKLVAAMSPTYARAHLDQHSRVLHEAHYAGHRRTFYADGLYWLNYFGPDELGRQGGEAVAQNPHARAERLNGGLLLEVGSDPVAAATPAGEQRLVAATNALPPARDGG